MPTDSKHVKVQYLDVESLFSLLDEASETFSKTSSATQDCGDIVRSMVDVAFIEAQNKRLEERVCDAAAVSVLTQLKRLVDFSHICPPDPADHVTFVFPDSPTAPRPDSITKGRMAKKNIAPLRPSNVSTPMTRSRRKRPLSARAPLVPQIEMSTEGQVEGYVAPVSPRRRARSSLERTNVDELRELAAGGPNGEMKHSIAAPPLFPGPKPKRRPPTPKRSEAPREPPPPPFSVTVQRHGPQATETDEVTPGLVLSLMRSVRPSPVKEGFESTEAHGPGAILPAEGVSIGGPDPRFKTFTRSDFIAKAKAMPSKIRTLDVSLDTSEFRAVERRRASVAAAQEELEESLTPREPIRTPRKFVSRPPVPTAHKMPRSEAWMESYDSNDHIETKNPLLRDVLLE